MAPRVQINQRQFDAALQNAARPELERRAQNVKEELRRILDAETEGTGNLADSITTGITRQRGKFVARVFSTADYARFFFRGTEAGYIGTPPSSESEERFSFWASSHGFNSRHLGRLLRITGTPSRMDILERAMETFRRP